MKTLTRAFVLLTALASATFAGAAEIKVFCTNGASAAPFETLVAKLGITAQVKPKYNLRETAAQVGDAVASGIVEIGVVALAGPFPKDIQSYVVLSGAVGASAKVKDAANKLLAIIVWPANLPVIKAKGMER